MSEDLKRDREPRRSGARWGSRLYREDRFALVFVLIILTILASALLSDGPLGLLSTLTLQTVTLLVTLRTAEAGLRLRRAGEVASIAVLVGAAATVLSGDSALAHIVYGISMILLVGITPIVIVRRLSRHPVVDISTVTGAADIYLLFGLFFAVIYSLVGNVLAHGVGSAAQAFFIAARPVTTNDFIYYSFQTLTTVGYGDIVASTQVGRMLSITEALLGQLYLVTVVALLVANIGRSRRPSPDEESATETPPTDEAEDIG